MIIGGVIIDLFSLNKSINLKGRLTFITFVPCNVFIIPDCLLLSGILMHAFMRDTHALSVKDSEVRDIEFSIPINMPGSSRINASEV